MTNYRTDIEITYLLLQKGASASAEVRACLQAALVADRGYTVQRAQIEDLRVYGNLLRAGNAMPVGSVEFVRRAMEEIGIPEPENLSYPKSLQSPFYLGRELALVPAGSVRGRWFIKPVATKAFTGFVANTLGNQDDLSAHDRIQYNEFLSSVLERDPGTLVWRAEPVEFLSEHRYYVMDGHTILGQCRYDESQEDAPEPDKEIVSSMIRDFGCAHPYALDVGVLSNGRTVLVEVNDAWAIGLYAGAMSAKDYLAFLLARWKILHTSLSKAGCAESADVSGAETGKTVAA